MMDEISDYHSKKTVDGGEKESKENLEKDTKSIQ